MLVVGIPKIKQKLYILLNEKEKKIVKKRYYETDFEVYTISKLYSDPKKNHNPDRATRQY